MQRANSAERFRHGSPRSCTSREKPSTSFAGPPPLSGEAYNCKLANAASNKVTHLHKKTPEYQHSRYRQGQQPALASPRRTASVTSEFRRTVSTWQHQKLHFAGDAVRCGHSPLHKQQQSKKATPYTGVAFLRVFAGWTSHHYFRWNSPFFS